MAQELVRGIWRHGLWIVPLCVLTAVAVGGYLTARQEPLYRASATVAVAPNVADDEWMIDGLETLERRTVIATFARIPPTAETMSKAARAVVLPGEQASKYRVGAFVLPNTNAIRIEAEGPDAEQAAALANAVARVTDETARDLYRIFRLELIASATAPAHPIHPDPARNYMVSGILGVFVGLLASFSVARLFLVPSAAARE